MPLVGVERSVHARPFSRRGLVIFCAIAALTISLASRTAHVSFEQQASVHSADGYGKIQHRDKDAAEWVAPSASFSLLLVAESATTIEPIEQTFYQLQYDSLYNRPPPIA